MIPTIDEKALQDALARPGAVLLDFWQQTCAPCRALEPRVERFVGEHPDAFRAYRIDVDAHPELTGRYDVTSIPTLILLHDGKEILRLDGLIGDTDLAQLLKSPQT